MKYLIILLLLGIVGCVRSTSDSFVLEGIAPGAPDSTEVSLYPKDGSHRNITGYVINGRFALRDTMKTPTYCLLRFKLKQENRLKYKDIEFFAENGELRFKTPNIDSLPSAFSEYDIRKEKNYRVTGSVAQDDYFDYQQQTLEQRAIIKELEEKSGVSQRVEDWKQLQQEREKLDQWCVKFIRAHRNVHVNLYVAEKLKRQPFTYDRSRVERMGALFASDSDTCFSLRKFRDYLQEAVKFAKGRNLEDVEILALNGEKVQLLDQLNLKGYTVIDFWASWCEACRCSSSYFKKIYERYGGQVKFMSIALNDGEENWKKALKEEQMPWAQFRGEEHVTTMVNDLYKITSIPTFLLVDAKGKIVYRCSQSGELEVQLESLVNKRL